MPFFTYVYVRVLNTRQWTSLRILSTPYVYVGRKKHSTGNQPLQSALDDRVLNNLKF